MKHTQSSSWRFRSVKSESRGTADRPPTRDEPARPSILLRLLGARPEPAVDDAFEDTRPRVFGVSGFG